MTPILGIIASSITAPNLGDYNSIQTVTVTSATQATIEFTNIPSTYTHLQLRVMASVTSATNFNLRFNGDTNSNYTYHQIYGTGAATGTGAQANGTSSPFMYQGGVGSTILDILDYANTNKFKTTRTLDGYDANGSGSIALWSGLWRSTNAITSISIQGGTFNQHSRFALYGIK